MSENYGVEEFGWPFSYLLCFTLVFLRDLKNPNYNDTNCLEFMFSDMAEFISLSSPPSPHPLTIADLPFAEKDEFRLSVLSWLLCSSQIINDLLVFAVIEEILTLLNSLNRFGEVSGSDRKLPSISFFRISYLMGRVMLLA